MRRVRPPGLPCNLMTAGAPRCGPGHPQVHARFPAAPTHGAPLRLAGDPEGTSSRPPPICHIATVLPPSTHASSRGDKLALLGSTGFS